MYLLRINQNTTTLLEIKIESIEMHRAPARFIKGMRDGKLTDIEFLTPWHGTFTIKENKLLEEIILDKVELCSISDNKNKMQIIMSLQCAFVESDSFLKGIVLYKFSFHQVYVAKLMSKKN